MKDFISKKSTFVYIFYKFSQISKIKYRRSKERNSFNVFGLYIVNHQRFLPPLDRNNPPFTKTQISDALNDERGLLSTWQLFTLFFDINDNVISKKEARDTFFDYGFIHFRPKNLIKIGIVTKTFDRGSIIITEIKNQQVKVGANLYVEYNRKFYTAKIQSIKYDDKSVNEIFNGQIGIRVDKKVRVNATLWTKTTN